jgi:hypothetical protein
MLEIGEGGLEEVPRIIKPFSHIAERRVFITPWLYALLVSD